MPASDGSVVECFPAAGVLGVLVAALLWWWGVVFDLWIVVASIWMTACANGFAPVFCGGWVCWCGLLFGVMQIFSDDSFFGFVL